MDALKADWSWAVFAGVGTLAAGTCLYAMQYYYFGWPDIGTWGVGGAFGLLLCAGFAVQTGVEGAKLKRSVLWAIPILVGTLALVAGLAVLGLIAMATVFNRPGS